MMSFTLRISPAITTHLYNKIPHPFAATINNAFLRRSYANQVILSEFPPVPVQDRPFNETVMESIWRHSLEQPTRPAFLNAENLTDKLTFAELFLRIHSAASFLDGIGFSHGDVAAVVLPNCWQYSVAFTSVLMRGGCISGINPVSTEYELHRAFTLTNCKVVFLSDVLLDRIWEVAQKCPHIQKLIVVPSKFPPSELPANLPDKIVSFSSLVNHYPNMRRAPPIDVKKDLAFLPFSSGTTGPPKAVMLSHQNIGTMATIFHRHFDTYIAKKMDPAWDWKREHFFLVLPFFHIYGFILSVNILLSGASGIVLSRFDLDLFCKTIQDFKIKFVMLVPPILVALAKSRVAQRYDLSSLRFIMTGAAPVGSDLCEEVKKAIPSLEQIAQGYGMTEESMASHLPVFGQHNMAAAGRLASNLEMKIADMGNHRSVPLGTRGEICCRGPTIMLGYLNNPEATAEAIDEEGWLRTGDIGYHDGKGWTYVVDRLKDLIKVKGFQVSPAELEDILLSHKGVKDCGVVGVPDRLSGEVPKAFIVKADEALTEQEVKEFVRTRVAKFKQLAEVEFVEEIPKSPSGKILKRLLPKP